jgi:hypothetical protein
MPEDGVREDGKAAHGRTGSKKHETVGLRGVYRSSDGDCSDGGGRMLWAFQVARSKDEVLDLCRVVSGVRTGAEVSSS